MPTHPLPVKTSVADRSILGQHEIVRKIKADLTCDPLLRMSEAVPLLGSPAYSTLQTWIKTGAIRTWRAGRGHYRIRLSEVQRFLAANEVRPERGSDAL